MEGKSGRGRPRQKLMDWMEGEYWELKKKHNIEKSGVVGHFEPAGREAAELKTMLCNPTRLYIATDMDIIIRNIKLNFRMQCYDKLS